MASSALIDDLLKQFAENPRRVFARLANEYRKAGEFEQAIEICRAHIPQHPGYISGHIVLGQALYDSGQLEEAKATFEIALGLDPENLIAIRQMGDIARLAGDAAAARSWYQRLLEVDPQNAEIVALLSELDTVAPIAPAAAPPTLEPESQTMATREADANGIDGLAQTSSPAAAKSATAPELLPHDEVSGSVAAHGKTSDAVAEHEPVDLTESFELLPELPETPTMGDDAERRLELLEGASAVPTMPGPTEEEPVTEAASGNPSPELTGVEAALVAPAGASRVDADAQALDATDSKAEKGAPAPAPPAAEPSAADVAWESVLGRTVEMEELGEVGSAPQAFVTETMAELYLQQGYTKEALDLYKQLAAQNPNDRALQERVAQLEHGARSSVSVAEVSDAVYESAQKRHSVRPPRTIRSFFARLAARRVLVRGDDPSGEQPQVAPDDGSGNGQPGAAHRASPGQVAEPFVGQLFGGAPPSREDESAAATLASAFARDSSPRQEGQESMDGEPTRAASSELSLDDVFREDDAPDGPPRGAAQHTQREAPSPANPTPDRTNDHPGAGRAREADDPGDVPAGDLENFNAWLEGLKK